MGFQLNFLCCYFALLSKATQPSTAASLSQALARRMIQRLRMLRDARAAIGESAIASGMTSLVSQTANRVVHRLPRLLHLSDNLVSENIAALKRRVREWAQDFDWQNSDAWRVAPSPTDKEDALQLYEVSACTLLTVCVYACPYMP